MRILIVRDRPVSLDNVQGSAGAVADADVVISIDPRGDAIVLKSRDGNVDLRVI